MSVGRTLQVDCSYGMMDFVSKRMGRKEVFYMCVKVGDKLSLNDVSKYIAWLKRHGGLQRSHWASGPKRLYHYHPDDFLLIGLRRVGDHYVVERTLV